MLTVYLFTVHRSQSLSAPNEQPYSARWNLDMFSCRLVSKNHAKFHPGFHLYVESVRLDERGKLHVLRVVLCSATYAAGEGKARALLRIYENTRRVVLNSSRTGPEVDVRVVLNSSSSSNGLRAGGGVSAGRDREITSHPPPSLISCSEIHVTDYSYCTGYEATRDG